MSPFKGSGSPIFRSAVAGEPAADRRAVLVGLEIRKLVWGNREFIQDLEDRVGIDGELGERHDLVMILAAVPAEGRGGEHAIHLGDFGHAGRSGTMPAKPLAFMRDDAIEDPVRLGGVVAHVEERQQDHHQEQADASRGDGQDRPDGVSPGVAENVGEVFHDAAETRVS